jgi:hypothetical protein
MATYTSTLASTTSKHPARATLGETEVFASVTTTAAVANADIINLFYVPSGAVITGVTISSTDIDTNGSPTVTIDVGDAGDVDRLVAATTIGRASGVYNDLALAGFGYTYTADTLIYATINSPATGAIGTIKVSVKYLMGVIS